MYLVFCMCDFKFFLFVIFVFSFMGGGVSLL